MFATIDCDAAVPLKGIKDDDDNDIDIVAIIRKLGKMW